MRVKLGTSKRQRLNRGSIKATFEICAKVKVYGTPGAGPSDSDYRLLEDGFIRLLENGDLRILE